MKSIDTASLLRIAAALLVAAWAAHALGQTDKGSSDLAAPNRTTLKARADTAATQARNAAAAASVRLEDISLLALGPNDGRAVLQFPDKKLLTVAIGGMVPGTHAVVTQVLVDRLVLEEVVPESQVKQVIWMFKGNGATAGRIQRLSSVSPANFPQQPPKELALPIHFGGVAGGISVDARKKP